MPSVALMVKVPTAVHSVSPLALWNRLNVAPVRGLSWPSSFMTRSFGGYIRRRLEEKCRIRGIELVTISPKDTASICSRCGKQGTRTSQKFCCGHCGFETTAAQNTARNIEEKAISAKT